jgi:hypothetical protein
VPTYGQAPRFQRDFKRLQGGEQARFRLAVGKFIEDLQKGGPFRASLRVRGVEGTDGVFEMTWAGDGRATFEYGQERRPGEPHVIWRRVGTHSIFTQP